MSVYVDTANNLFGRMRMCHMVADDRVELLTMADAIDVQRKWIQKFGTAEEHFDICKSKRAKAVMLGAIEVTQREMVRIIKSKRLKSSKRRGK
jgi:hypothetical protein